MVNPKIENKKDAYHMANQSFMRNTYLEIHKPIKDFKIIGRKRGKWAYYDENKNITFNFANAKYQKWIKFSDEE